MDQAIERYKKQLEYRKLEKEKELEKSSSIISAFIEYCRRKGFLITKENIDYVDAIGLIVNFPNIVNLLNEKIIADKEELVPVNILEEYYEKKGFVVANLFAENYIVMAHPYFRRGHHKNSNYAPHFVQEFWNYNKGGNQKYLSIDFDRVRINVDSSSIMELDHWYGPKFKSSIPEIVDDVIKLKPDSELEDHEIMMFYNDVYSLDLKWSTHKNLKSFYSEEFKTPDIKIIKNEEQYYPVKYIHSQYDLITNQFVHLDGAIHFYTEEEYYQRRDQDLNYNNKNNVKQKVLSQKLFKINGEIEVSEWINLISHFLSGNPLVFEYFEGKLPKEIEDITNAIKQNRDNKKISG